MLTQRIRYQNRELRATKFGGYNGMRPMLATQSTKRENKLQEVVGNRTPGPFSKSPLWENMDFNVPRVAK